MLDPVLVVDDEITLEPVHWKHASDLLSLVNQGRSSLRQWLPWVDLVRSLDDEKQYIGFYRQKFSHEGALTAAIRYRDKIVGIIGFNSIDWTRFQAPIGYWLGASFQGKGVMTRSCKRLLQYGFEVLCLHKIKILCAVANERSQRIPLKLGFTREGCLRESEWLYDHYVDLNVFALLAHDWNKSLNL